MGKKVQMTFQPEPSHESYNVSWNVEKSKAEKCQIERDTLERAMSAYTRR